MRSPLKLEHLDARSPQRIAGAHRGRHVGRDRQMGTFLGAPRVVSWTKIMKRVVFAVTTMLMFGAVSTACGGDACSPCRPGTYPSNPSLHCSSCVPCHPDGGPPGNAAAAAPWCASGDAPADASSGG
jgi:hypothetical protein